MRESRNRAAQLLFRLRGLMAALALFCMPFASEAAPELPTPLQEKGAKTKLKLPRFVSLRNDEGNARRGPSREYQIDWVFKAKGLPLVVIAEYENWRLVQDHEGEGGWMHWRILSNTATALMLTDQEPYFEKPDPLSLQKGVIEQNAILRLGDCVETWCEITAQGKSGWVRKDALWGTLP